MNVTQGTLSVTADNLLGPTQVPVNLGPLGTLLYLPAKFKLRVLDPVYLDVPPNQERYSKSRIMDEAEEIRVALQENLYDMLQHRRSLWFG